MINPTDLQMRGPSPEWIEDRVNYLGATDIAAIMGLHPYRTAHSVYLDKKGLSAPIDITQAMVHGQNLELYVAQLYRSATGRQIHKSKTYKMKDFPYFAASPDYEVRNERPLRLVECKTAGYFAGQIFGAESDAVPDQYLVQCMWQLAVTGRDVCDLACLIGGQDFRIYTIARDNDLIETLLKKAADFWHTYIVAENPPPLSGEQPDVDWVKAQHPQDSNESLYAPPEVEEMCLALFHTKNTAKAVTLEQKRLENEVKMYMGSAGTLETCYGPITWKCDKNGIRSLRINFKEVSTLCPTTETETSKQAAG